MGKCKYCGASAGLFKHEHKECKKRNKKGRNKIVEAVAQVVFSKRDLNDLQSEIRKIAEEANINDSEIKLSVLAGWEAAIDEELSKGLLSEKQEALSDRFIEFFELTHDELNQHDRLNKAVQSLVIWNLENGRVTKKFKLFEKPPVIPDDEEILWIFFEVNYYMGATYDLLKIDGKYYKVKEAKKTQVDYYNYPESSIKSRECHLMDEGGLVVTNKGVYFFSKDNGWRIGLDEIVSIKQYDDGIEIHRGNMVNSPILFQTFDGWFTYELINGLRRLRGTEIIY